jgi:CRP/FNR family transcriptional regulator, cyclic AMP receptor protein
MPARKKKQPLDAHAFLDGAGGPPQRVERYGRGDVIFSQGDACETLMYIQQGEVRLSVSSRAGKEAIVGVVTAGSFFGEDALGGRPIRLETATSVTSSAILVVTKDQMLHLLHTEHALSDRFILHMLARETRLEGHLADQLFNGSEKRLARALLLLAGYDKPNVPARVLPNLSQEMLADMIGTTRPRVNFFMRKFARLGFIEHDGRLTIVNGSLLRVVVHE